MKALDLYFLFHHNDDHLKRSVMKRWRKCRHSRGEIDPEVADSIDAVERTVDLLAVADAVDAEQGSAGILAGLPIWPGLDFDNAIEKCLIRMETL